MSGRTKILIAYEGSDCAAAAGLSMWMSNIAAAAMMLSAVHPLLAGMPEGDRFRRALLLNIAVGANFGGIATPLSGCDGRHAFI